MIRESERERERRGGEKGERNPQREEVTVVVLHLLSIKIKYRPCLSTNGCAHHQSFYFSRSLVVPEIFPCDVDDADLGAGILRSTLFESSWTHPSIAP